MEWIDMHCDTLSVLYNRGKGSLQDNDLCVDFRRLEQAHAAGQFFACYVNVAEFPKHVSVWDQAYRRVLEMAGYATGRGETDHLLIRSRDDFSRAKRQKKTACILTVEEGGVLHGKAERLEKLYGEGIRLITLTWNYDNCIGSANSTDPEKMKRGLTDFGFEVIERMNKMRMIIDVSHLSDGGFYDCVNRSAFPVVASHSNARALCAHPRNLSDEMLRALGEKGGVAGVNFYSPFLRKHGRADVCDLVRHALHIMDKGGEDVVALGADLDGFGLEDMPRDIQGVQDMGYLWEALKKAGVSSRQVEKMAFGNVNRILCEILA